ncbi:hypothetical protein, partial [Nostoc sp.]|uniref:hypothetical protein n=1 Tax=Nostoc sp. TaxID=1180 RepID=UPI002FF886CC
SQLLFTLNLVVNLLLLSSLSSNSRKNGRTGSSEAQVPSSKAQVPSSKSEVFLRLYANLKLGVSSLMFCVPSLNGS